VRLSPKEAIAQRKQAVANSVNQMMRAVSQQVELKQSKTAQAMHLLDAVSPLKTLGRGYSIIRDSSDKVVKTVAQVSGGDTLRGQLTDGEVVFSVTETTTKTL
jgi:exodeoxyribonuclease VII large subunit